MNRGIFIDRAVARTHYTRAIELSDQAKSNIILIVLTAAACALSTGIGLLLWLLTAISQGLFVS